MIRWSIALLCLSLFSGCDKGPSAPEGDRWVEKVRLANGEIIVVQRENRYGGGEPGARQGPLLYASLEFDYRGQHYKWAEEGVEPYVLEVDAQGRPVVAGGIGYDWARALRGRPCDPYVVQYAEGGRWVQIPSWEMTTSPRSNLAANMELGLLGQARADTIGAGAKSIKFEKSKERCEKQNESAP